jgi:hypothetical protein
VQQPEEEEGLEDEVQPGNEQRADDAASTVDGVDTPVGDPVRAVAGVGLPDRPRELRELLDTTADDEFGLVDLVRGSLTKKGHRPFRLDPRDAAPANVTKLPSSSLLLRAHRTSGTADVPSSRRSVIRDRWCLTATETVRASRTVLAEGDD